jgi:hypothetical protein
MRCGESNGSRRRKTKHVHASLATSAASRAVSRGNGNAGAGFRGVLPQWRFEIVEAASWKREETRRRGSIEVLV